jgi:hypothetical protein
MRLALARHANWSPARRYPPRSTSACDVHEDDSGTLRRTRVDGARRQDRVKRHLPTAGSAARNAATDARPKNCMYNRKRRMRAPKRACGKAVYMPVVMPTVTGTRATVVRNHRGVRQRRPVSRGGCETFAGSRPESTRASIHRRPSPKQPSPFAFNDDHRRRIANPRPTVRLCTGRGVAARILTTR